MRSDLLTLHTTDTQRPCRGASVTESPHRPGDLQSYLYAAYTWGFIYGLSLSMTWRRPLLQVPLGEEETQISEICANTKGVEGIRASSGIQGQRVKLSAGQRAVWSNTLGSG